MKKQFNTPTNPSHDVPSTSKARPMAEALTGLRQQLRAEAQDAAISPSPKTPSPRANPKIKLPAQPLSHAAQPDPLATIHQPHNAPLPKPLAQALIPLSAQVHTRPSKSPPAPVDVFNTAPAAPATFADLLREQNRQPTPAALQEKINWGRGTPQPPSNITSTKSLQLISQREETYTQPLHPNKRATPAPRSAGNPHALQDLKTMHKAFKAEQAKVQAERTRQQAKAREQNAAKQAFLQAVGTVQALPDTGKVIHHQPREPIAMQRQLDEQAVLREALSDEFDAGTLLDTDEDLSFLRPGVSLDIARKLRKGEWTIQKQVDLHGLRTDEAREALGSFIRECHRTGLRCVRVIHGKGLGSPGKTPVLKSRVHRWLVQKAEVMAFVQANPNQGGHGAVVVLLRPPAR